MSNDHVALSRRGFLKGTLATAGVALAGASHAGDIPAEWAKPKCSNWSWEKPMEKIPADQIKKTVDTDVVVIGAGLTGFSAALSAAEEGAKVVVVEKTRSWSARGGHITAFGSKVQKSMKVNVDAAEIVRRLIAWGQGRMDERLLWMFAKKCGACMDWAVDLAAKNDVKVTLWEGYYKGPTYTEFPVTHFFYNKDVSLDYTYGNSTGIGNVVLMPCFEKELKAKGVNIMYRTPAVQLIREKNNGRVTGLIVGRAALHSHQCQEGRHHRHRLLCVEHGNAQVLFALLAARGCSDLLSHEVQHGRRPYHGHADRRCHAEERQPRRNGSPRSRCRELRLPACQRSGQPLHE